jgi:hypothetical protein
MDQHEFAERRAQLVGQHQASLHTATQEHRAAVEAAKHRQRENARATAGFYAGVKEDPEHPDHHALKQGERVAGQPPDLTSINDALDVAVRRADADLRAGMMRLHADLQMRHARAAVPNKPVGYREPETEVAPVESPADPERGR